MNKHVEALPKSCKDALQEFVGDRVNLDEVVIYSHVARITTVSIVVACIGYSITVYKLYHPSATYHPCAVTVDESVLLEDLVHSTGRELL